MTGARRFRVRGAWLRPILIGSGVMVIVAAGAVGAIETRTVASFWRGLWWSISLVTTVGFIGEPPETALGAVVSVVLMIVGFVLLAMVSASLASLFVREQDAPHEAREATVDAQILDRLAEIDARLHSMESKLGPPGTDHEAENPPEPDAGTDEGLRLEAQ
jgi:hypothetical protein